MLWFNFIFFCLNFIFFCFKLIIIHYHTQKQKKKNLIHKAKLHYPGYQRFFLACDKELRRPQAGMSSAFEDTSGKAMRKTRGSLS